MTDEQKYDETTTSLANVMSGIIQCRLVLIDKLIEAQRDFVAISDPVLFQYNGGQA